MWYWRHGCFAASDHLRECSMADEYSWLMSYGYMFDNVLFYHFVAVIINLHYSHSAIISM